MICSGWTRPFAFPRGTSHYVKDSGSRRGIYGQTTKRGKIERRGPTRRAVGLRQNHPPVAAAVVLAFCSWATAVAAAARASSSSSAGLTGMRTSLSGRVPRGRTTSAGSDESTVGARSARFWAREPVADEGRRSEILICALLGGWGERKKRKQHRSPPPANKGKRRLVGVARGKRGTDRG